MFDPGPVTTEELRALVSRLAVPDRDLDDAARIERIAALERLKGAAAAAQARVSIDFDASQRAAQAAAGVPARKRGAGVGAQIALARRDSAARGGRHLGLARALVAEMPHTLKTLARGETTEWRATIVARETATLSAEHRREVDARLAGRLPTLGDQQVEQVTRALAYQLDPSSPLRRIRGAVADRRVSIRPAPDAMARVTGFLPVAQGVAVWAALQAHAGAQSAAGDERSRGQLMADAFVERLTGQTRAEDVGIEVGLVMTDAALLAGDDTPARLHAAGLPGAVVPAAFARQLLTSPAEDGCGWPLSATRTAEDRCGRPGHATGTAGRSATADRARVWLRRLFTSPTDGSLVAMDSHRREFDGQLRAFLVHRDQYCRTPWCGAPIRHADHVRPDAAGGPTSADNGQGLCAACNYTKELPGWAATTTARSSPVTTAPSEPPSAPRGGPHVVRTTTPTRHAYDSTAPPVLEARTPGPMTGGPATKTRTAARTAARTAERPTAPSPLEVEYARLLALAA